MRQVDIRQILNLAELIASELAAVALDPASDLTASERRSLMVLSIGIQDAAARSSGVPPRSAFALGLLMRAMEATLANDNCDT